MVSISTVARMVPGSMPEPLLGEGEHLGPEPRLQMGFHLRQVERRTRAAVQQFGGVVEEVQAEVDQRTDQRRAVDREVLLRQVPAARPGDDDGELAVVQPVGLAVLIQGDGPADGVAQVDLPGDHVRPGRGVGVLQVGQPDLGAGIQRVDRHLAVGRAGDLHPAVGEVVRNRRDGPDRRSGSRRSRARKSIGSPTATASRRTCRARAARPGALRTVRAGRRGSPGRPGSGSPPTPRPVPRRW